MNILSMQHRLNMSKQLLASATRMDTGAATLRARMRKWCLILLPVTALAAGFGRPIACRSAATLASKSSPPTLASPSTASRTCRPPSPASTRSPPRAAKAAYPAFAAAARSPAARAPRTRLAGAARLGRKARRLPHGIAKRRRWRFAFKSIQIFFYCGLQQTAGESNPRQKAGGLLNSSL